MRIYSENLLRSYIRQSLLESGIATGPNYQTLDNNPISWESYPGLDVQIYPDASNGYWVEVECTVDDSLSAPLRLFATEEDAQFYARKHAGEIKRDLMSRTDIPAETINLVTIDSKNYESDLPSIE